MGNSDNTYCSPGKNLALNLGVDLRMGLRTVYRQSDKLPMVPSSLAQS
jgi:hypothetical protein